MNKLKFSIAALLFGGLALTSCIEHEVIPAPTPTVDLKCSFDGVVNGTDVHLMQFIDGYDCTPTKAKYLLPAPQWSTAVYYSEISSAASPVSFKIGMGSVAWDASTTSDPTLALFNDFFTSNLTPNFSNVAVSGIEVSYRDAAGRTWVSHDNSVNAQNASFTGIITFKNNEFLREALQVQGIAKLILETDSPYLAPEPKRGKENEPSYLPFIGEFLSGCLEVPVEEIAQQSYCNASKFYGLEFDDFDGKESGE